MEGANQPLKPKQQPVIYTQPAPPQQIVYVDQNGQPIQPQNVVVVQPIAVPSQQGPSSNQQDTQFNLTEQTFVGTQLPAHSATVYCPNCKQTVKTKIHLTQGIFFWLIFCALWLICCCCVAFCVPELMDARHTCPNCNNVIGERKVVN